jgi:hypothetical protein
VVILDFVIPSSSRHRIPRPIAAVGVFHVALPNSLLPILRGVGKAVLLFLGVETLVQKLPCLRNVAERGHWVFRPPTIRFSPMFKVVLRS